MNVPEGIHVGIQVRDPVAALGFYRDLLGLKPYGEEDRPHRHVWGLQVGNSLVKIIYDKTPLSSALAPQSPEVRHYGYHHLAFMVEDGKEIADRCRDAGVEILVDWSPFPDDIGDGSPSNGYCYLRDPDGNLVEFSSGESLTEHGTYSPPGAASVVGDTVE